MNTFSNSGRMLWAVGLFSALWSAGCEIRDNNPFLGRWTGKFAVESAGTETGKELARNDLKGYLQVYATHKKFEMYLVGEQETLTARGEWSSEGNRMILKVLSLEIDDAGGEMKRRMDKKYILPDDLREAYHGSLALELSEDKQKLVGQKMTVGLLIGAHQFQKVTNRYTY
jgi:hypothetical protein